MESLISKKTGKNTSSVTAKGKGGRTVGRASAARTARRRGRKSVLSPRPGIAEIDSFIASAGGKPMTRKTAAALRGAGIAL